MSLDATHDPARRSWVTSAKTDDTRFPIQNLPLGVRPDNPLLPNYKLQVGADRLSRPRVDDRRQRPELSAADGQLAGATGVPSFVPCQRLDYEILRAYGARPGARRIGFGECRAR